MGEILINQLFAGAYLQEGNNIGHEVINLFRDDNDKNYLFITPSGSVSNHEVDKVVFVKNIKAKETMEVVMMAENLSETSENENSNIYYAGVNIKDIFNKNLYHGEKDSATIDIMATYYAKNVRMPLKGKRIIITVDPDYVDETATVFVIDKTKIVGQGMRTYLSKETKGNAYNAILGMLEDESLWEKTNTTPKMIRDGSFNRKNTSFLEIIRKENDELVMSNLLAYYFNYNHRMFVNFAKEVLKIESFEALFEIKREKKNIDLWIQDEHNVIVIENKVKSGINGKTDDGKNQLDKYYRYTETYKADTNIKDTYYYIFAPDYNDLSNKVVLNKNYKIIYYSKIYDFFRQNAVEYLNDKYFPDFLVELKNQTMTSPELSLNIMRNRFLEKIEQSKY